MKILLIGDIVGSDGLNYFKELLPTIKNEYKPNLIIVNGENIKDGRGINLELYKELMKCNVSLVTLGNHAFDCYEVNDILNDEKNSIIRPANYNNVPGKGYKIINYNGKKILFINLMGRIFTNYNLDNPFLVCENIIKNNNSDYIFVDFHGEASSEKIAFAKYFDGKITCIYGTHTHVATADCRILPKGTLYQTDLGMTGPYDGVIGASAECFIELMLNGHLNKTMKLATGKRQLNGAIVELGENLSIRRIHYHE